MKYFVGGFLAALVIVMVVLTPWYMHEKSIYETKQHLNMQQEQIVSVLQTRSTVDDHLSELLKNLPTANHIFVSMLQSDFKNDDVADPLTSETTPITSNVTNSVTALGYNPLPIRENIPLTSWRDFIPQMLQHKCAYVPVSKMTDQDAKIRVSSYAYAAMACPIFSVNNDIVGAIFVSWAKATDVPCLKKCKLHEQTMRDVADLTKKTSSEIGNLLTTDLKSK